MSTHIQKTNEGHAAPESRPVADTTTAWSYTTAHRVLETEIPPFSGVAVARFMPGDAESGVAPSILAFAAAAIHVRRDNESQVLFLDAEELGKSIAEKKVPDLLAIRFKADPNGEKGVYKLWRGRFAKVNLRDHNSGGEQRITRVMEMSSVGGFWALVSFSELGTDKIVVTEKIVPKDWGVPIKRHQVGTNLNGKEALPLHEDAYDFAVQYPSAWDAVRLIAGNLGHNVSHMETSGRDIRGLSSLQRPERTKTSGGFSVASAVPASSLDALKKRLLGAAKS